MAVPASLEAKMELFKANGRIIPRDDDLFTRNSWVSVMLGQGLVPRGYDPLVDALPADGVMKFVSDVRSQIADVANGLPSQTEFISKFCGAAPN